MDLDKVYKELAKEAIAAGIPCGDSPAGPLTEFLRKRCRYREGTLFFIVVAVACEMADMAAQAEGYENACDRAVKKAFAKVHPKSEIEKLAARQG